MDADTKIDAFKEHVSHSSKKRFEHGTPSSLPVYLEGMEQRRSVSLPLHECKEGEVGCVQHIAEHVGKRRKRSAVSRIGCTGDEGVGGIRGEGLRLRLRSNRCLRHRPADMRNDLAPSNSDIISWSAQTRVCGTSSRSSEVRRLCIPPPGPLLKGGATVSSSPPVPVPALRSGAASFLAGAWSLCHSGRKDSQ